MSFHCGFLKLSQKSQRKSVSAVHTCIPLAQKKKKAEKLWFSGH